MQILFALVLGVFGVMQATVNKKVAESLGLTRATVINSAVFLVLALVLLYFASTKTFENEFFHKKEWGELAWWFVLPGICGLCVVVGLPWSVSLLGASTTFVCLVAAQMVTALVWDWATGGAAVTMNKIVAALLVIAGVWIGSR